MAVSVVYYNKAATFFWEATFDVTISAIRHLENSSIGRVGLFYNRPLTATLNVFRDLQTRNERLSDCEKQTKT